MTPASTTPEPTAQSGGRALAIEANGINAITVDERHGKPRDLFWPWFGANVSVLAISYGSYVLGFGISFWQAAVVAVAGVVASNLLVGLVAIAGKRGSAPTMTLSRSAFGVRGNRLPAAISWVLTVGWETVLAAVAVLATATVFGRLGWGSGTPTKVVALIVVVGLIALAGTLGFDLIMKAQRWVTPVTAVLTVAYIGFAIGHVDLSEVSAVPGGTVQAVIGAFLFTMTGFGLGWVNAAADYSRYLPRSASSRGVVGWTTLGASLPPATLLVVGLLLAGSSGDLSSALAADPVGALTTILPTWFLVPFALVAVLGLVGGAVMDVYSSGLALLNAGLRVPRSAAVGIDSAIMLAGAVYIVFASSDFLAPFQGFLITLGVPIAAWAGVFLADLTLRRTSYAEADLFDRAGRYGDVRLVPIAVITVATVLGWGLVTNTAASWLQWQGYLLGASGLGGKDGAWAYANLGVIVALVLGYLATLLATGRTVRRQETGGATPLTTPAVEAPTAG
jgi:NCS1 family nucleobase:cation symporter-1